MGTTPSSNFGMNATDLLNLGFSVTHALSPASDTSVFSEEARKSAMMAI